MATNIANVDELLKMLEDDRKAANQAKLLHLILLPPKNVRPYQDQN